jgi:hypothetical protein
MFAWVTRRSVAPGVQRASGSPPRATHRDDAAGADGTYRGAFASRRCCAGVTVDGGAVATGFVDVPLEDDEVGSADDEHPAMIAIVTAIAAAGWTLRARDRRHGVDDLGNTISSDPALLTGSHVFGADGEHETIIPITQDVLAQLSGCTRPTANRTLRAGEEAGVIKMTRGRIEILDLTAL